jgi:hypothetical protein
MTDLACALAFNNGTQGEATQATENRMTTSPIDPLEMLERLKNPEYLALVRSEEERLEPNIAAILAGIRFIHDFSNTPEGKAAVEDALDAGFVHIVEGTEGKLHVVPRFIWPDYVYEDIFPGHSLDVAVGVAAGRHLLWGDPKMICQEPCTTQSHRAVVEAVRHFVQQRAGRSDDQ